MDAPCTVLLPFDLTRGGNLFPFHGHTDVKELALYAQDTIIEGNWAFNLGVRFDLYRGIVHDWQPEPRVGVAYNIKKTNSVLRVSYSRVLETPFNENLILASLGAANPVITDVIGGQSLQVADSFRPTQSVQCRLSAGVWKVRGRGRRLLVEIHAQRV